MGRLPLETLNKAAAWLAILAVIVSGVAFALKHFGPWDPRTDAADVLYVGVTGAVLGFWLLRWVLAPAADNGVHFETRTQRGFLVLAAILSVALLLAGAAAVVWALAFGKVAQV